MEVLIKNWRTVVAGLLYLLVKIVGLYYPLEGYAIIADILVTAGFIVSGDAQAIKDAIKSK